MVYIVQYSSTVLYSKVVCCIVYCIVVVARIEKYWYSLVVHLLCR